MAYECWGSAIYQLCDGSSMWQPMRIAGLDEDVNVMHGDPLIRIPIVFGVQRAEDFTDVELRIEVRYQACTDSMCFAPTRANLLLRVPLAE